MQRVIITCLSVHWTAIFAIGAMQALQAAVPQSAIGLGAGLAVANALCAMLFAWAAVLILWEDDGAEPHASDVLDLACAVAVVLIAISAMGRFLVEGEAGLALAGIHLAGIAVTCLTARRFAGDRHVGAAPSHPAARRLALEAAHGTMLGKLSMRQAIREPRD